jgi:hypothetical protein
MHELAYKMDIVCKIIEFSVYSFGILGFIGLDYLIYKKWIARKIKDGMK